MLQGAQEYADDAAAEVALNAIAKAVSMTREEVVSARASFVYPDEKIQAVIDEATDKITAILLGDVG